MMRITRKLTVAAWLLILASQGAIGEENAKVVPDSGRGRALAENLCQNCHLIDPRGSGRIVAGVPSFSAIANKPEQTAASIALKLIQPHMPMPNLQLTRKEIDDLIAYLDTLRKESSGAPLIPGNRPTQGKPTYPKQS